MKIQYKDNENENEKINNNEQEEIEEKKSESKIENQNNITPYYNYNIDYYKGNISNLLNQISEKIPLEEIPDFLKRAFLLNDLIYIDDYYFKGLFPKVIISTEGDEPNKVKGLCSFYYENNENLNEILIIRINCIFAIDNYEKQIIMMIDFIKKNVKFNRLEVYILYDKKDDKFVPNNEAKELFQNNLGFKWLCVVRDEKKQQRYIKLYYEKEDDDYINDINNDNNNFSMNSLSIITINNEEDTYILKNKINNKSKENELNKKSYNKYINPHPIYSLILDNSKIKKEFTNEEKSNELKEIKQKLWRFVIIENGWNFIEDEKKKIKNIQFDLKNSVFKEIENFFMTKEKNCYCDLYQTNLSINFETNYSILIDDIYYNRISSDKIKVLKEKKTNSTFFLIPSNDNTTFFYIAELNKRLSNLLIDNNKNIYEQFLEFQPSSQKEFIEFSVSSYRDISYIPQTYKKSNKTIYIPSFSINTHLFSYNFKEAEKNIKMVDNETNTQSYLNSVDEYLKIEFKPDKNIDKSFSVIPVEGGVNDAIIKDSFVIGIFDNDVIKEEKLPLLQFLHITKDHFLKKDNYIPGN